MFLSSAYRTYSLMESGRRIEASIAAPQPVNTGPPPDVVQAILSANLFNAAPASGENLAGNNAALPELHGTFVGSGATPSYAIMAEAGQPEKSYQTGDRLPDGAEITKIEPDHVIIVQEKTQHAVYLRPQP